MKKALIFLSLSLLMVIGLFALSSCSMILTQAGLYDGYEYHVDSDYEITLTGYTGEETELDIPAWIDGYKVVGIAFDKNDESLKNIESIKIPKTITSIGYETFLPCTNLKEIRVDLDNPSYKYYYDALYTKDGKTLICYPQGREDTELEIHKRVTKIEKYALVGATNLKNVTLNYVQEIGEFAFSGCSSLETIELGSKLKVIGDGAFENCTALTSVSIPNVTERVGSSVFKGCTALTSIGVGSGVKYVGNYAFGSCEGLENLVEYEGAYYLGSTDNPHVVFVKVMNTDSEEYSIHPEANIIYGSAFENCTNLKSINLPNSVSCIGQRAFYNCKSLTAFEIPEEVSEVSEYTFHGCTSLSEVIIPSSVSEIGNAAFSACKSLESVVLSNRTKSLGYMAFSECTSLKSIEIPDCLTYIGNSVFSGCIALESISIPSGLEFIGELVFERCKTLALNEYDNAYYIGNAENPHLILLEAKSSAITSCSINENTRFIYQAAFYTCTNLVEITIPDSVTYIGASSFAYCTKLEAITVPAAVGYIGETAFFGCTGLLSVTVVSPDYWISDGNAVEVSSLSDGALAAMFFKTQEKFMTREEPDEDFELIETE